MCQETEKVTLNSTFGCCQQNSLFPTFQRTLKETLTRWKDVLHSSAKVIASFHYHHLQKYRVDQVKRPGGGFPLTLGSIVIFLWSVIGTAGV